jgi:hypothetical protein
MLDNLLRIVGVDLEAKLAQLTARARAFRDETKHQVREEIAHASITAGLAFAALLALAATCVVALIALYIWIEPQHGPLKALAAVGIVTALTAIVMGIIAASRAPAPVVAPEPIVIPMPTSRPALNLADIIAPPPPNASIFDVITHRVTTRAASATDEAIDVAHDTIAHGSRPALIATLAAAVVAGWIVGRRGI